MWAETSREGADVKEEWSVKRRKQCRKKKEEGMGWDGSFGWVDLYGGEHWHLFYHSLPSHPSQETVLGSLGCLSNQKGNKSLCVS